MTDPIFYDPLDLGRVRRGCGYRDMPISSCYVGDRKAIMADNRFSDLGFRLVRNAPNETDEN